jgi:predicted signal transduction protein with EAL and GGDEF domain
VLGRLVFAAGAVAARVADAIPTWLAVASAALAVLSAAIVVVHWVRTADWEHDERVTAAGHRTAPARREEARATTAWIRQQRRLARDRRRRERVRGD